MHYPKEMSYSTFFGYFFQLWLQPVVRPWVVLFLDLLLFRKAKESGNNSSFRSNLLLYTIPHSGRIGCYKYFRDCVLGTHVIVVVCTSIFGNKATTSRRDIKGEEKIEIWARIHILTQIWCFCTRSLASCWIEWK